MKSGAASWRPCCARAEGGRALDVLQVLEDGLVRLASSPRGGEENVPNRFRTSSAPRAARAPVPPLGAPLPPPVLFSEPLRFLFFLFSVFLLGASWAVLGRFLGMPLGGS